MSQTDKRWGGKRRPRITMPTPFTAARTADLFRVEYVDKDGKQWHRKVLANSFKEAETVVGRFLGYDSKINQIVRDGGRVHFQYETFDVRYRGEHQDLLAAK